MTELEPRAAIGSLHNRRRLHEVILRRPRVGAVTGLLLALAFALVVTPIVLAESWAVDPRVEPGERALVTVRVRADDVSAGVGGRRSGGVIIARGEVASKAQSDAVKSAADKAPHGSEAFAAYGLVLFALAAGFTHHLKRSTRGRVLRVQLILLGTIALGALVTKGLLLAYPLSVLAVPVALGAIVPTLVHDRTVGLATGVLAAVVMALLVRFDVGVVTVLVIQAVSAAIVIPERPRPRWALTLFAGAVSLAGAALTYMAFAYLTNRALPFEELATPAASSFVAASVGGVMAAVLAMPLLPLYERACGEITHGSLVALEDLSHPLLKQIAEKAPGTWQHSLAMANLAEVAANAIGANGRLVRVGAYFHDLGKSLQPTYFIENLAPGEPSPHDQLAPEVSCDAIFSHVTEGILLARRHKLPERIVDFMHMHHGDGVLEYFWAKCQEQGNPRRLTVADFRYPGVPPQSRETAILAVCDAVEAASRTLKRPDARSVENLVQRIVYGKLHLGQLDESGLSMADLRRMSDSLREAIRHAHHDRIEYPWQREAAAEAAAAAASTVPTVSGRPGLSTQRLMAEPRLDSLDAPRPMLWDDRGREAGLGAVITPAPSSGSGRAPVAADVTPSASGRMPRAARELAAFGDTIDLAIATTAGLGGEAANAANAANAASTASAPSAASSGPTADALADAVVAAEAPAEPSGRRPATLPPPMSTRPPAPSSSPRLTPPPMTAPTPPPMTAPTAAEAQLITAEIKPPPVTAVMATPAAPPALDEEAHRRAARPTEPLILPNPADRASRAVPAVVPMTAPPLPLSMPHSSPEWSVPTLEYPTPPGRRTDDDDEPEIEMTLSADDAVVDEVALPTAARAEPPPPPTAREWLGSLSARIDAMLEADEELADAAEAADEELADAAEAILVGDGAPGDHAITGQHAAVPDPDAFEGGDTARRPPPTPPGRSRPIPRMTQPVDPDDIEASIELSPTVRAPTTGVFVGPPPRTRSSRSMPAVVVPPTSPPELTEDDPHDRPTVVGPQPSGSMLPPRSRRGDH